MNNWKRFLKMFLWKQFGEDLKDLLCVCVYHGRWSHRSPLCEQWKMILMVFLRELWKTNISDFSLWTTENVLKNHLVIWAMEDGLEGVALRTMESGLQVNNGRLFSPTPPLFFACFVFGLAFVCTATLRSLRTWKILSPPFERHEGKTIGDMKARQYRINWRNIMTGRRLWPHPKRDISWK